jgi:beta-lactamase regulating signal transducer with metallopeptidase domain/multidrug resistance efflux pump
MNAIYELARDAALKSVFILMLATLAVLCMPRSTAATRHMIWLLAVISLLALPAFSLVLPRWNILLPWAESRTEPPTSLAALPVTDAAKSIVTAPSVTVTRRATTSTEVYVPKTRFDWANAAVWGWLGGAALALLIVLLGRLSLWRVAHHSQRVTRRDWLALLQRLKAALSLKRLVVLIQSERRRMPMTWGLWRPKVLLPKEAEDWPAERRRVVLLHELAHVKRWDYLATLLTQIVCALYWFNPLVWLAARRMVAERERACDDLVLSQGAHAAEYAEQILELASTSGRFASSGAIAMARRSNLEGRLLAILDAGRNRARTSRLIVFIAVALMASIVVPTAMLRAATEKRPDFGPVIERTIYDPDTQRTNSLLDLDTGKLFSEPALPPDQNTPSLLTAIDTFLKLVRTEKIDLLGDASGHSVMGLDMVAAQVPNEQFESLHVEWLVSDKRLAAPTQTETWMTPKEVPATYIFKTREGGRGILQIVRFNNHQNADIRYKVVSSEGGTPNANRNVNEDGFESRVMMILASAGKNRFLNLEDGKSYASKPTNAAVAYLEKDAKRGWQFVIENIYNYHTEREDGMKLWETMTAREIAQPAGLTAVPFERTGHYELGHDKMPATVLIPEWGLLRIEGFDDRTSAVIIQYKRVAGAGGKNEAARNERPGQRRALSDQDQVARIRLQHAEQELERVTQLYNEKIVGREQLDAARTNVDLRRAELTGDELEVRRVRLRQAENDLDRLAQLHKEKLVSGHELDQARRNVALRKAELDGNRAEAARIRFQQAEQDFKRAAELWRENLMSGTEYQLFKQAFEIARAEMASGTGSDYIEYTIRQGETLERIAAGNGVTPEALRRANPNVDWKRLKIGQKVLVPSAGRRN